MGQVGLLYSTELVIIFLDRLIDGMLEALKHEVQNVPEDRSGNNPSDVMKSQFTWT